MKLQLYYPRKPFVINQRFGESKTCSNPDTTGVVSALPNGTCPTGKVPLYPLLGLKGHNGIDLQANTGDTLYAPMEGTVKELSLDTHRGLGVGIVSNDPMDFEGGTHYAKVRQWHGQKILVEYGQPVKVGDPIMLADNTGYSAGSHDHFELEAVQYTATGAHVMVYPNNGYQGAVDPLPYFNGLFAQDIHIIPKASDQIAEFAAKLEVQGNTIASKQCYALAAFLRAFGY